jgi:hypothetical protein
LIFYCLEYTIQKLIKTHIIKIPRSKMNIGYIDKLSPGLSTTEIFSMLLQKTGTTPTQIKRSLKDLHLHRSSQKSVDKNPSPKYNLNVSEWLCIP